MAVRPEDTGLASPAGYRVGAMSWRRLSSLGKTSRVRGVVPHIIR
jgi:hypothetical protein